ncbi:MAG: hypothetical protein PHS41_11710 [Victivallaceae bacterium]|nr:hypothetical protein [Victivallaceae bacterium]
MANAEQLKYGIRPAFALPDGMIFPEECRAFALPFGMRLPGRCAPGSSLIACDPTPVELSRLIPGEKLENEFVVAFAENCRRAKTLGVRDVLTNFDANWAVSSEEYAQSLIRLLRRFYGILLELDMRLLLPLRLPRANGTPEMKEFSRFLMRVMVGRVGYYAKIFVHDPNFASLDLETALNPIDFKLHLVELDYEPMLGNRLTAQHLERVRGELRRHWWESIPVIFAPETADAEFFSGEIRSLFELLPE